MFITTTFALGKLKLPGVFNPVSLDGLQRLYTGIAVCDHCGHHFVWSAPNRVEHLADPGTFRPIGHSIQPLDFLGSVDERPYATKLIAGQKRTGLNITARHDLPHVVATLLKATGVHTKQRRSHSIHTSGLPLVSIHAPRNAAWESVHLARHPHRPTARNYIRYLSPNFLELQGDRCNGDDPTVVAGLGEMDGRAVIFIGQERLYGVHESHGGELQTRLRPEGYRKAIRIMDLAAQLHCPLVTFVDTSGADPGDESERHGIAWSLAHCLSTMSSLPVPIVTAIIGDGASGGAVAFAVADHILMLQNAIYEVIAPEGAATILYRGAQKATQIAEQLKLTAADCLQLGVVDAIIPEPPAGAHTDPPAVMQALQQHLRHAVYDLEQVPVKQLLARRYRKFRRQGRFQRRQYLLTCAAVTADGQEQSLLYQLKDWLPRTSLSRWKDSCKKSTLDDGLPLTGIS